MDEPTNDLDVETLGLLEELVAGYPGTLLLVSHDREFLDNVVTSTLVFEGGGAVNEYVGGYSDWQRQRRPPTSAGRSSRSAAPTPAPAPTPTPTSAPRGRRLSFKDRRELELLPARIQGLETEQQRLQREIGDPSLFKNSPDKAGEALARLATLAAEIEDAYARWHALESGG